VKTLPDKNSMIVRRFRPLVERIQRRLASEEGFSLIELMIVILTMGILMTVAIPTFLSFKDNAAKGAAKQGVSQAIRAVQSYKADNFPNSRDDPDATTSTTDTGFLGISLTGLAKYDASLVATAGVIVNPNGWNGNVSSATDFCLTATSGRWVAVQHGPDTPVTVGTLFTPATCAVS
jgi:prepilin-type N-terminal cleavage/methylation domain-containing protein